MKSAVQNQNQTHTDTAFVRLNSYVCTACWKCMEVCPNDVIDKSFLFVADTLVHQQVLMYDAGVCTGCMKCIQVCEFDAISIRKHD